MVNTIVQVAKNGRKYPHLIACNLLSELKFLCEHLTPALFFQMCLFNGLHLILDEAVKLSFGCLHYVFDVMIIILLGYFETKYTYLEKVDTDPLKKSFRFSPFKYPKEDNHF